MPLPAAAAAGKVALEVGGTAAGGAILTQVGKQLLGKTAGKAAKETIEGGSQAARSRAGAAVRSIRRG